MRNNRGRKIFLIVCAVMIGAGLIVAGIGVGMGATAATIKKAARTYGIYDDGYNDYGIDDDQGSDISTTANSYKDVKNLDVDIDRGQIIIANRNDIDEIKIVNKSQKRNVSVDYDEGEKELSIDSTDGNWMNWKHHYDAYIVIYIPVDYNFNEVDISLSAGRVEIDKINTADLDIDVDAGELDLKDFKATNLDVSTGAGSIKAAGDVKEKISIDGGVGEVDVTLIGKEGDFNYNLEVGIGEISIGGSTFSSINNKHINNTGANKDAEVECGIGTVKLKFK